MATDTMASKPTWSSFKRPENCEVYKEDIFRPRHCTLKWKIENFSDVDHKIVSGMDGWFVEIRGAKSDEEMYRDKEPIFLYFGNMSDTTPTELNSEFSDLSGRKKIVKGKLSIMSSLGKLHFSKMFKFEYHTNGECVSDKIEFSTTRAELKMAGPLLLPNNVLTIHCEFVTYFMKIRWEVENLSTELNKLFEGKRFADVAICTSQEVILAHKCILVARSPVLAQRIENLGDNVVDLSHMEPTMAKALVTYLYTGNPNWIIDDLTLDVLKQIPEAAKQLGLFNLGTLFEIYKRQDWNIPYSAVQENIVLKWIINIQRFEMEPHLFLESSWFKIGSNSCFQFVIYAENCTLRLGIEMLINDPLINFELQISVLYDEDTGFQLGKVDTNSVKRFLGLNWRDSTSMIPSRSKISLSVPIDTSYLTELLKFSSTLKIQCSGSHGSSLKKCQNHYEVVTVLLNKSDKYPANHFHILSQNMKQLLESQSCSDFVVKAQGAGVPCHIAILTTRLHLSFEHRLESMSLDVNIEASTFKEALCYFYTGRMNVLTPKIAEGLLKLASKYSIVQMKKTCSEYLIGNLTKRNACKMLDLAKECSNTNLETAAERMIRENYRDICRGSDWDCLQRKYPRLELDKEVLEIFLG